jgi:hypothetical protein
MLLMMVKHYPNSKVIRDSGKGKQDASPIVIWQYFIGSSGQHLSEEFSLV